MPLEYFHQQFLRYQTMPVELLVDIVKQGLPATVVDAGSIDKLRVLRAARLIKADIPQPGDLGTAIVLEVTYEGHSLLDRVRSAKDIV